MKGRKPWFGTIPWLHILKSDSVTCNTTVNHPLEEPHRAEEEGSLRRFLQRGAPRRCVQPSRSAGQGRFPAQGCAVFSGKGLTWRPGVGPGCRQEEHEAEAAAEPERGHGQAGPRRPPLQGSCPAPRRWELFTLLSAVPSFSLIRWFYRLFYLTHS